jgi:hypothetical protein
MPDAVRVIALVIRDALSPAANDFQGEARAVIAAIQADTEQGDALRAAILGLGANQPALWDRLDKWAPLSAQMIQRHAPHTAELICHAEPIQSQGHDGT